MVGASGADGGVNKSLFTRSRINCYDCVTEKLGDGLVIASRAVIGVAWGIGERGMWLQAFAFDRVATTAGMSVVGNKPGAECRV